MSDEQASIADICFEVGFNNLCDFNRQFLARKGMPPSRFRRLLASALIAGLDMRSDLESLLALYLAGLCGLGYGARQIVRAQQDKGIAIETIVVSGGAAQSRPVRQVLADDDC
ncbi:sugar (pentulose or hexulose) kinase [Bradyrhizobium sp. USDA 4472]